MLDIIGIELRTRAINAQDVLDRINLMKPLGYNIYFRLLSNISFT